MYDPVEKPLEGTGQELFHCAFEGAKIEWSSSDPGAMLRGARFLISSGGFPRKEGMTREDLLKGNCEIARKLGQDIREYAPNLELGIIIFNPADITGLTCLLYSGLAPNRLLTLAALDSTRLQTELALHWKVAQDEVQGCRTYGGHGEKMVAFKRGITVSGKPLEKLESEGKFTADDWKKVKDKVVKGGSKIIELRGRSSFQSPAHQSILMLRAYLGGGDFTWPSGLYVEKGENRGVIMAVPSKITKGKVESWEPEGSPDDMKELKASVEHLRGLRAEAVKLGILPPIDQWGEKNPHMAGAV
jgi:malate dehydrogenase